MCKYFIVCTYGHYNRRGGVSPPVSATPAWLAPQSGKSLPTNRLYRYVSKINFGYWFVQIFHCLHIRALCCRGRVSRPDLPPLSIYKTKSFSKSYRENLIFSKKQRRLRLCFLSYRKITQGYVPSRLPFLSYSCVFPLPYSSVYSIS